MRYEEYNNEIARYVLQKNDTAMSAEGSLGVYASPESTFLSLSQLIEIIIAAYMQLFQSQKLYYPVSLFMLR